VQLFPAKHFMLRSEPFDSAPVAVVQEYFGAMTFELYATLDPAEL
jgi:hypothetical protein